MGQVSLEILVLPVSNFVQTCEIVDDGVVHGQVHVFRIIDVVWHNSNLVIILVLCQDGCNDKRTRLNDDPN